MRNLQPRFARHLMGFPQTDFGSLVQALYGIEKLGDYGQTLLLQTQRERNLGQALDHPTVFMMGHKSSWRP